MKLSELVNPRLISMNLDAKTREEAIEKLTDLLQKEGRLACRQDYIQEVLEREKSGTTGIGQGVAIPHGKTDAVIKTSLVIGRLNEPIDWESLDGNPVKIIFLLAVQNKDASDVHLKILAHIASKLMDEDFIHHLLCTNKREEIIALLEGSNKHLY